MTVTTSADQTVALPSFLTGFARWECRLKSAGGGYLTIDGPGAIEACGDLITNKLPPGGWRVASIINVGEAPPAQFDPDQFIQCTYGKPLEARAIVEDFTAEGDATAACATLKRLGWEEQP